jgi:hypothetical protein
MKFLIPERSELILTVRYPIDREFSQKLVLFEKVECVYGQSLNPIGTFTKREKKEEKKQEAANTSSRLGARMLDCLKFRTLSTRSPCCVIRVRDR